MWPFNCQTPLPYHPESMTSSSVIHLYEEWRIESSLLFPSISRHTKQVGRSFVRSFVRGWDQSQTALSRMSFPANLICRCKLSGNGKLTSASFLTFTRSPKGITHGLKFSSVCSRAAAPALANLHGLKSKPISSVRKGEKFKTKVFSFTWHVTRQTGWMDRGMSIIPVHLILLTHIPHMCVTESSPPFSMSFNKVLKGSGSDCPNSSSCFGFSLLLLMSAFNDPPWIAVFVYDK